MKKAVVMEVSGQEDTKDPLPLPSLRLLVPPVRLMSAVLWRIMQQQDVLRYGLLADFVSLVTEAVPELFSPTHSAELALGLRAKLILELCYRGETATHLIQPHLSSIQLVLPLVKHVDSTEVEETWVHFVELVQTLTKDSEQREHFFQNVFPVEFGPSYDSALQTLMWDFLSRLEHFLPVPDLLQTVSWLRSESSALKDCEESISNPDSLRSLLHHHKRLGHLDTCASSSLPPVGDSILTALSGKRNRVAEIDSGASLNPPAPSEMCVMDGTDVETVVVTSEWTEIELRAIQTEEDNSDDGNNSLPEANCDPNGESQSNGNMPESEIQNENYLGESALSHNNRDGFVGCTEPRTADSQHLDCDVKETQSLSCSVTPPLESELTVPVSAPDGDAVFTRRSSRKPKKTWKVLVNLQKQKRKPGVDRRQKRERKPLAPMRNSGTVTDMDGECIASENGDVAVLSQSPGRVTSDGNTELPSKLFSCPQCTFTHLQERYVKSHMKKVHPVPSDPGKEPYVCQVCGKGYRYPGMLKAHERSHTGEQPFQCTASHCGRRFSYSQALRRHRTVHSLRTSPRSPSDEEAELKNGEPQDDPPCMYSCLYCSESFSSLSARREHHKTHPEDDLKRCNDCGKRLSCQAALIRHKQGHEGEQQHKCLLCSSSFVCTTSFKRHMLMHRPERPYHCSCGKGFTYKGALLSHQRTHTTERRYRCSHCNRCFLYPGELRKHERTHSNEKPYLCPHCGKSFKRERILRAHVAGHTEDKIFKCSSCNKTFAYKASLTRHELTHTGERPFLCSDCGKTFFSFGELLKHQRYHTGIKPFQCSHCDKSFTQACYLQLHTRYHTGVRPYACTQCNKSFFTSCRLKRHMQVHTDEKPYECTECGKRFRQAYVLKVHQRSHLETELRV